MDITIAPTKQIATIKEGKKVLKKYKFKTKIPFVIEQKQVSTYDYGSWCVSDRGGIITVEVKVFCSKTITDLKSKILQYYLKQTK